VPAYPKNRKGRKVSFVNNQPASAAPPNEVRVLIPNVRPTATYALLGILAVVFLAELAVEQTNPDQSLITQGALSLATVAHGDYYRLLTAMFLHVDPAHIFFNGYALYVVGVTVERFFGHFRFLAIYFLGGLAGGLASIGLTSNPESFSVGASGAIFAIFGAEIVFLYLNRRLFARSAQTYLRRLVILAVLNFAIDLYTQIGPSPIRIDLWAHVGGFIAGIVLAWLMGPRYRGREDPFSIPGVRIDDMVAGERILVVSAAFAVVLVVLFFVRLGLYQG